MKLKICGISDIKTLKYLTNHPIPPQLYWFYCKLSKIKKICRIKSSKRFAKIDKKKSYYVAVLVKPNTKFLKK